MMSSRQNRWRRVTTCPSRHLSTVAILFAALLPQALPLQAQERQQPTQTTQEGRRVHVVREGDTLWDLANFYLSDPFLWPEIYRINTMVVEDPHWIYPTEELLVPRPGEVAEPPPIAEREAVPRPEVERPPQMVEGATTVFAAPVLTRTTLTYQPTPPVPASAVTRGDFYRASRLMPLRELGPRGELVDVTWPRGYRIEPLSTVPRYGRIYLSHLGGEPPAPGDRVVLFRIGRRIGSYGHVIIPTGLATIAAVHEDVSTAIVTDLYERVLIGDQAVAAEMFEEEPGVFARPVSGGPSGRLIAPVREQIVPSVPDEVFIDLGRSQGIELGDEFDIYAPVRRSPTGYRVPEEHVASGRVVRVTEGTSTLRLLEQRHPTVARDLPVRMVRRMP